MKNVFRSAIGLSIVGLLLGVGCAKAGCVDPGSSDGAVAVLPFMPHWNVATSASVGNNSPTQSAERHSDSSIVGLWHVSFVMSNGTPFYESFDLWHSDGTEFESSNVSPLIGNVCVGVWKERREGMIRLHHVGWTFPNGILIGSFTLDETISLAREGTTYNGSFVFQSYDLSGTPQQQIKGTLTASRIIVDD